jgi:hypothetical protein
VNDLVPLLVGKKSYDLALVATGILVPGAPPAVPSPYARQVARIGSITTGLVFAPVVVAAIATTLHESLPVAASLMRSGGTTIQIASRRATDIKVLFTRRTVSPRVNELGRALRALRERALASGLRMMTAEEIDAELGRGREYDDV